MGQIHSKAHHEAEVYIPDHFSHATLVHELHIEGPYAREGLIAPNAFWEKVEASYLSDPRLFLRQHQCAILDYIVRHDHLPGDPDPTATITLPPPMPIDCPPEVSSPPTGTITYPPVDPQFVSSVPEPSSIVLAGLAALMVLTCVFSRALGRRPLQRSGSAL